MLRAQAVGLVMLCPLASFCAGAEVSGVRSNFRDCADCPEMVIVPAGEFVMGSPGTEPDRSATESPQRKVAMRKPFAMGRFEVMRGQFAAFVRETGYQSAGCRLWSERDQWRVEPTRDWRDPGFAQTDEHPVTCINWYDARAYASWLSRRTGRHYRLPSEAEWEYAARAGTSSARHWGEEAESGCAYANGADQSLKRRFTHWTVSQCDDDHAFTAPVGALRPNAFGLHDTLGSLWEWVEDCWNDNYENAPADQAPWLSGECGLRVLRGGAWFTAPRLTRSASRFRDHRVHRFYFYGFRVAADL